MWSKARFDEENRARFYLRHCKCWQSFNQTVQSQLQVSVAVNHSFATRILFKTQM